MFQDFALDASIEWFEKKHPLPNSFERKILPFENTQREYEKWAEIIADRALDFSLDNSSAKSGSVFVGYGFSTGAIESNKKRFAITHQHHYEDTSVWNSNISSSLNIDVDNVYFAEGYSEDEFPNDEDRRNTEIGEYLKWLTNPEGNTEIADEVLRKLCIPMIKEVSGKLPGRSKKEIRLILPLMSSQIDEPDWEELFKDVKVDNTFLSIEGPAILFQPEDNERVYAVYQHMWEFDLAYIVQVIEKSQLGTPVSIGAYAFFSSNSTAYYELKNQRKVFIQLNSLTDIGKFEKEKETTKQPNCCVNSKLNYSDGFLSYLGSHSASFYWEFYSKVHGSAKNALQQKVADILPDNGSVQMASICAKLCEENNLVNISLSDMVSVGIALENRGLFQTTTLTTKNTKNFGSSKSIIPFSNYSLLGFPSNYGSFVWKCNASALTKDNYMQMKKEALKKLPIDQLITKIIVHFSCASTSDIAEELLFIYGSNGDPTALFTARLFGYLWNNVSFVVESKSEEVDYCENSFDDSDKTSGEGYLHNDDMGPSTREQKEETPEQVTESSIIDLWNKYKKDDTPLIVVKRSWNRDYCFVVEQITRGNSWAAGAAYIGGKKYKESGYSATQKAFLLYTGPSKDIINKLYRKSVWDSPFIR